MLKIWPVDAFTDQLLSGNPAAVCILDDFFEDKFMLKIAAEMNLSETAFLKPALSTSKCNYQVQKIPLGI